jgi:hypothetical protein
MFDTHIALIVKKCWNFKENDAKVMTFAQEVRANNSFFVILDGYK